ncbi:MAG TPA: PAS domain S-box protein [Verrucomicrobiae bacterium]|nr:PAS domain S-box protein [Verrucomicrobiae bacterium]
MQILIVEDSIDDTLLLLAEMKQKGYTVVHRCVDTPADFVDALQSQAWDAVISDYSLPQFSGPGALNLLREHSHVIPFIMVSGVYGEEHAVAMMRAGANDYITKNNLSRLVPALEREWDAAQNRRQQKRAEAAMQHLAAIIQSSEDAIYSVTLDSHVQSWNPAAERLYGYKASDMIGRSVVKLFPLSHRDELLDTLASVRRGETVHLRHTARVHQDGDTVAVSIIISPIKNNRGEVTGASSIARDIRQQQQVEQDRQQLFDKLAAAAGQLNRLHGLLPSCSACHRVRDDKPFWQQVEARLLENTDSLVPASLCPECAEEYERQLDFKDKLAGTSPITIGSPE